MTHSYVWNDSFICVSWLIHMCDMTHSYVWHDSFICVSWLIHVWHDSFICVTWLIHMCDMTHWRIIVCQHISWHVQKLSTMITLCLRNSRKKERKKERKEERQRHADWDTSKYTLGTRRLHTANSHPHSLPTLPHAVEKVQSREVSFEKLEIKKRTYVPQLIVLR